jgi:hypothetical protein
MIFQDNRDFGIEFLKKFEFSTHFAHFEANFEAQNVNKKGWELKSRSRYL